MPRQVRLEYEGAIYHVMNRGDRREAIFRDDDDRRLFLETLGMACGRAEWQVHALCLMGNHFHLVMETPKPTLVAGMKWFFGTYTMCFNARHKMRGHLFAGRYKSLLVDNSDDFYLRVVYDYVHLNPPMLKAEEGLETYPWSSYPAYLQPPGKRPPWLRTDRLLGEHKIRRDDARGRRSFAKTMEELRETGVEEPWYKEIRRGWRIGAEDFLERLTGLTKKSPRRGTHAPREVQETMEIKAKRLAAEFLQENGQTGARLKKLPKSHPLKLQLARLLREETTVTLAWIAHHLHAGAPRSLANALRLAAGKSS